MPPTKRQQNNKGSNKDISQAGRNDIKSTWDVKGGDMQKKFIDKIYIKLRNIVTKYRRSNFFLQKVSICSKHVMLFLICDKMLHCTTKNNQLFRT